MMSPMLFNSSSLNNLSSNDAGIDQSSEAQKATLPKTTLMTARRKDSLDGLAPLSQPSDQGTTKKWRAYLQSRSTGKKEKEMTKRLAVELGYNDGWEYIRSALPKASELR